MKTRISCELNEDSKGKYIGFAETVGSSSTITIDNSTIEGTYTTTKEGSSLAIKDANGAEYINFNNLNVNIDNI